MGLAEGQWVAGWETKAVSLQLSLGPKALPPSSPAPSPASRETSLREDCGKEGSRHQPHHLPAASWSPRSLPEARAAQDIPL